MTNKQKLYSIALVSIAMILMLTSIAGAAPYAYIPNAGGVITSGFAPQNANSNNVSIIDTATNTVTATVKVGANPIAVAVSGTNIAYVANIGSNNVSIIDTATNTVVGTYNAGFNKPIGVAVSPDGTKLYVLNSGFSPGDVSIIDIPTNTIIATPNVGAFPIGIAVSPDGKKVYVTNSGDSPGDVSIIDTNASNATYNTNIANVPVGTEPAGVAVSPDGKKVYVANTGDSPGDVSVIDTATNTVTTIPNVLNPLGVAVTPDGTKLYVTNYGSAIIPLSTVTVINTATENIITTVPVGNNPEGVAVTHDGKKVYVTNALDNTTSVIDTSTNTVEDMVTVGLGPAFLGIGKPAPTITWNNPANITYGTSLSSIQLDAIASVLGTFVYIPPAGTILGAGSAQTLSTIFIPTDIANYTTASASVLINVNKATPTITWSTPANITYGTPLNSTQLDATASVPGNFVYNPPSGTVLSAGTHTLNAIFTPTDIANYTTASASVLINVNKATPTIIWSNPADICQSIPLNYDQLDAAASPAAGTFYYNPNVGTVLSTGNQTLHVDFTPADASNYTNAHQTVYINVNQCQEKPGFFHQTEYSTFLPFQWG